MEAYWRSIKSIDTEEKLDLYFYRPAGFVLALLAEKLRLVPTHLSVVGMLLGVTGGFLYYFNDSTPHLVLGTVFFILAGIFDSSDGQLARLTGNSSKWGIILDGICDNLVFASVYLFASLTQYPVYGPWIFAIAALGGICHSFQSALLDFYNREYLYFGYREKEYWNPNLDEAATLYKRAPTYWERLLAKLRYNWLFQQHLISTRTPEERLKMKQVFDSNEGKQFSQMYKEENRLILRFWRLMGPNFHTLMIILFVFLRRFDLYLILVDILALNVAIVFLRIFQRKQDWRLLKRTGLVAG